MGDFLAHQFEIQLLNNFYFHVSSFRWNCLRFHFSFVILQMSLCVLLEFVYAFLFICFHCFSKFAPWNCWCAPFQAIVNAKTKFDSNLLCFAFTRSNSIFVLYVPSDFVRLFVHSFFYAIPFAYRLNTFFSCSAFIYIFANVLFAFVFGSCD